MKILIVDDSATMRKIIRRNLRQAGYDATDVLEAGDGAEALTVLDGNTVDVIFSDVNMPNMGGVEFLDKNSFALYVHGKIDHDWPGTTRVRNLEGTTNCGARVGGPHWAKARLRDRAYDVRSGDFLKSALPNAVSTLKICRSHLPRDRHERCRVVPGVGDHGNEIRNTGPRGHHHDPRLPRKARRGERGVSCALFVSRDDVLTSEINPSVQGWRDRSAGKEKDPLHTGIANRSGYGVGADHAGVAARSAARPAGTKELNATASS